jgi:hypothetical protein
MRPEPLFRAVRRLLDRRALVEGDLSIDIYSDQTAMIARSAQAEGVNGIVRALDYVPRETILRLERRADRLLFFVPDGTGADTVVGGKTLEYFGARKRVLAIGGGERSAIDDVLRQAAAGTRVTTLDDIEAEVLRAVSEFKEDRTQTLSADAVATFDAPHLAGHFAQLLDRVIATRRSKAR